MQRRDAASKVLPRASTRVMGAEDCVEQIQEENFKEKRGRCRRRSVLLHARCWRGAARSGAAYIGPNNVMFWPKDGGETDGSWEGQATRRMYLRRVYSAVWVEMMRNGSGDVSGVLGARGV